eukprot:gb/GECG01002443.1/.p1 GENE.gb/GECG01002443.1/~~gb/GECG01002443.1/.p1  ORF type:complete len:181 (+),score=39.84 gb/GECG01002443.1/:1-543(+)
MSQSEEGQVAKTLDFEHDDTSAQDSHTNTVTSSSASSNDAEKQGSVTTNSKEEHKNEKEEPEEPQDLPLAGVNKVVKRTMDRRGKKSAVTVTPAAKHAANFAVKLFLLYLSSSANDVTVGRKRKTVNADDVFQALDETGFGKWNERLRGALEAHQGTNKRKKMEADIEHTGENDKQLHKD